MYGNCQVCGARFGTTDGKMWYLPCEHMRLKLKLDEIRDEVNDCRGEPNAETI